MTQNKNSRIVTRTYGSNRITETSRRDEGTLVADLVSVRNGHNTSLYIDRSGTTMKFTGREVRTLLTLLEKHYYGS